MESCIYDLYKYRVQEYLKGYIVKEGVLVEGERFKRKRRAEKEKPPDAQTFNCSYNYIAASKSNIANISIYY